MDQEFLGFVHMLKDGGAINCTVSFMLALTPWATNKLEVANKINLLCVHACVWIVYKAF